MIGQMPFERKKDLLTHTGLHLFLALAITACATPRPVLYPNLRYEEVGQEAAELEIDQCIALAEEFNAKPPRQAQEGAVGDVIEETAVGAATGAAVGAVVGNVGRGAAVGAAGGAARTTVRGIFRGPRRKQAYSAFHQFVERCLERRGYELVDWN